VTEIWRPNVVVAAVVQQDGRFLLVEEETTEGVRLNQPAGHWEEYETLLEAVRREALEETGYHFEPAALLGIYRWKPPAKNHTYLRFAFTGALSGHEPDRPLDAGIIRPLWLSLEELRATQARHRSPLVLRCVEDYLAGKSYTLDLLTHLD